MSGGSKTQTTTQTNKPYKAAQPLLDNAMKRGNALFQNGQLVPSASMSGVVPMSGNTQKGLWMREGNAAQAAAADPIGKMFGNFSSTYGNGGYNDQQRSAINALMPTVNGDYLNRADPNFERVLATTKENAATDVGQMMSGMGRFAGGSHQGILADRLGNIEADARLNQYNTERDRQTNAINSMFGMGQSGMQNVGNAADIWSSMLTARDQPAQAFLDLGASNEGYNAAQINDQLRRADAPLTNIQSLLGIAQGAGQYGTATSQQPRQSNTFSNILGGGLGLASLLGGF